MGAGFALFHRDVTSIVRASLQGSMLERCDLHTDLAALLVR